MKTFQERFNAKVFKKTKKFSCWPWLGFRDPQGNGRIWVDKETGSITTQRAVILMKYGGIPPGYRPLGCPILKDCVNPDHISLATDTEVADRVLWKKWQARREAKKTPPPVPLSDDVIRAIFLSSEPASATAKKYGVSRPYVWNIWAKRKRKNVTKDLERPKGVDDVN